MKQSYISVDKRNKKAQKEYYAAMRQTWNGLNPVTRTVPNGKAYNRKKAKYKVCREFQDECSADYFYRIGNFVSIR